MAKQTLSIPATAAKSARNYRCPECGKPLPIGEEGVPHYATCPGCAAIAIFEPDKRLFRMLKTQEWLDCVLLPGFYDLLEGRQALLDKLTAPRESKTGARSTQ